MLAGELALAASTLPLSSGAPAKNLAGSRAGGLHSRTIEVLDQRGIADRFLSEGRWRRVAGFAGTRLDVSDFPTRHPYALGLWQNHIERILVAWVGGLAVPIYRAREVTGFAQDDTGVGVELSTPVAAGRVSRWVRRRSSLIRIGSRHRVPRVGSDDEQPDREVEMAKEPELASTAMPLASIPSAE